MKGIEYIKERGANIKKSNQHTFERIDYANQTNPVTDKINPVLDKTRPVSRLL